MEQPSLWRDPVYPRVWLSHAISQVGSSITLFALPLLASRTLGANNLQVSLLQASQTIPLLVLGLLVGVWVDRTARLPLMVGADLIRMLLLALIPLAWLLGWLSYGLVLVVLVLIGTCSVLYDVASQSLVNSILPRAQLILGNARIHSTYAVADLVGPAGAGFLLRLVPVPVAFAIDALTFGLSALALIGARGRERRRDRPPAAPGSPPRSIAGVRDDVRDGLAFLWRNPTLRLLVMGVAIWNLSTAAAQGMFVLYLTNTLGLGTATIGLIITMGGLGLLAATVWPLLLSSRLGLGRGITAALLLSVPAMLLVALVDGPPWVTIGLLVPAFVAQELFNTLADTNQFGLRNAVTPDRLRGRVASAARVIIRSTVPIGFVIGGALADMFGYRAAMLAGAIGPLVFAILVARSPIMALHDLPPDPDAPLPTDPPGTTPIV